MRAHIYTLMRWGMVSNREPIFPPYSHNLKISTNIYGIRSLRQRIISYPTGLPDLTNVRLPIGETTLWDSMCIWLFGSLSCARSRACPLFFRQVMSLSKPLHRFFPGLTYTTSHDHPRCNGFLSRRQPLLKSRNQTVLWQVNFISLYEYVVVASRRWWFVLFSLKCSIHGFRSCLGIEITCFLIESHQSCQFHYHTS